MPRKELTLAEKVALLDQIKDLTTPNITHRRLEEITGVPRSTLARVLQQQTQLREEWASHKGHDQASTRKRKRDGKNPDVEEALIQWFSIVNKLGVRVTGPMLKTKSQELAAKLGYQDFKPTDGWLSRWKSRHDIKLKKGHGEKDITGAEAVSTEWKSTKLPTLLQNFCEDNIYNVTETALLYRDTPDGSLRYSPEPLASKTAMDRVTVLCCCNMSGTDRRKLLVIGKTNNPRCFKGLRADGLPVRYVADKNAWLTSRTFTDWLTSWDLELQQQCRMTVLLLDKCCAHPHVPCLQNVHLEFLPPNSTSFVQPMDMGIAKDLKMLYRGSMVNYIEQCIEENQLSASSSASQVSERVNLLVAMQLLADCWRQMPTDTIQTCFANCGFKNCDLQMPDTLDDKNELILKLRQVKQYEEFASSDNNLACYDDNEDCDVIVKKVGSKRQKTVVVDDDDDDGQDGEPDSCEIKKVTDQDARKFIDGLRRYFMQQGNEGSPITALDICADFVQSQPFKTFPVVS